MSKLPILLLALVVPLAAGGCKKPPGAASELHALVLAGDTAAVRKKLAGVDAAAQQIDVLVGDARDWTPLHHAAVLDRPAIAGLLIDYAKRSDLQKGTPLFGRPVEPGLLPRLLEARTRLGATALLLATPRSLRVMDVLIAAGADPNATDKAGMTPLHVAVPDEAVNAVARLLKAGADPRQKNAKGFSARDLCPRSPLEAELDAVIRKDPTSRDVAAVSKRWNAFLEAIKTGAIAKARALALPRMRARMEGDFPRWVAWRPGTISVQGSSAQVKAIVEYARDSAGNRRSLELEATWVRGDSDWSILQVRRSWRFEERGR